MPPRPLRSLHAGAGSRFTGDSKGDESFGHAPGIDRITISGSGEAPALTCGSCGGDGGAETSGISVSPSFCEPSEGSVGGGVGYDAPCGEGKNPHLGRSSDDSAGGVMGCQVLSSQPLFQLRCCCFLVSTVFSNWSKVSRRCSSRDGVSFSVVVRSTLGRCWPGILIVGTRASVVPWRALGFGAGCNMSV